MERLEKIGFGDLILLQDQDQFCYGIDAVILADFANSIFGSFKNAVDIGTGNGIIPLILSHKKKDAYIAGIDIQNKALALASKSCDLNGLQERIKFVQADAAEIAAGNIDLATLLKEEMWCSGSIDMVTCNPPYFVKGGAIPSRSTAKFIARHETTAQIEDFIKAAAVILKHKGHFFMVHRPSRLADIFFFCRKHGMEPKDMRMVVPKAGEAPNIVLIHCIKGGGRELNVMKELAVYDDEGRYSDEIEFIYERR